MHIVVAHNKISHNKLIIGTPHSTFICSYPSTFKITIKIIEKKNQCSDASKNSLNDGSIHTFKTIEWLSVTGITHQSVQKRGIRAGVRKSYMVILVQYYTVTLFHGVFHI